MDTGYRSVVADSTRGDGPRFLGPGLAIAGFLATLAAYATGVFEIAGGVVWIPGHAALVAMAAALLIGALRGGVLSAWLVAYAPLLGYRADHAFFGLSHRTRIEQAAYFLDIEGLVVLGLLALVFGTVAFALGWTGRRLADTLSAP